MKVSSYKEVIEYLEQFIKPTVFRRIEVEEARLQLPSQSDGGQAAKKDPLDRMRKLLGLLGNPQEKFKSIQVSGTSGKSSTAYFISHILTTGGYKTGFTFSPHLQKVTERIVINDKQISDEDFVTLVQQIQSVIERIEEEPSYFEILMAMAFVHFAQQKVDIAVVEVGIEGKYDASNVLSPLIAVLTNIDLDHTEFLGSTVEEIAGEAVSIIHNPCHPEFISGSPTLNKEILNQVQDDNGRKIVVTGVKQPSVVQIVEQRCKEVGAELLRLGKEFRVVVREETAIGSSFDFFSQGATLLQGGTLTGVFVSMPGEYQVENAAIAIETVLQLQKFKFKISEEHIRSALQNSFFPGRFEIITLPVIANEVKQSNDSGQARLAYALAKRARMTKGEIATSRPGGTRNDNVTIVLDGAHNPAKMSAFLSSLKKIYPTQHKIFVLAFKEDKDITSMLSQILEVADIIIFTEFKTSIGYVGAGSMESSKLKSQISKLQLKTQNFYENDSKKALKKALQCHSGLDPESRKKEILNQIQNDKNEKGMIVVTGSLYLVGEVKGLLS